MTVTETVVIKRVLLLLVGIISSFFSACLGFYKVGNSWTEFNGDANAYMVLVQADVIGVGLIIFSISVGPILLGQVLITIGITFQEHIWLSTILSAVCTACVIGFLTLVGVSSKDANSSYFWFKASNQPKINTLNQLLGCFIFAAYIPLAVTCIYWTVICVLRYFNSARFTFNAINKVPLQRKAYVSFHLKTIFFLWSILILLFCGTLILPHCWFHNSYPPTIGAYFATDSSQSLIHNAVLYRGTNTHVGDPSWWEPVIYIKLYLDVVVYYGTVFCLVGCGLLSTYWIPLKRILHHRIPIYNCIIFQYVNIWPHGITRGELLLVLTLTGLHAFWCWYWTQGWSYRKFTILANEYETLQLAARTTGEVTILTMSFLIWPVTRNSALESVFGVPVDRALKYHRALGVIAWLLATVHMFLWQLLWLLQGTLANNAWLTTSNLIPAAHMNANDEFIHKANFTIPLMEFVWMLSLVPVSLSFLRNVVKYELFVYSHFLLLMFFGMALVHAYQSWYYLGGGLVFYAFDKCVQFISASQGVTAVSLEYDSEARVTRIVIPGDSFGNRVFDAGSYCWINIPTISLCEWHPFSISSPPHMCDSPRGVIEFAVLNKGEGTWTGMLAELAVAAAERVKSVEGSEAVVDLVIGERNQVRTVQSQRRSVDRFFPSSEFLRTSLLSNDKSRPSIDLKRSQEGGICTGTGAGAGTGLMDHYWGRGGSATSLSDSRSQQLYISIDGPHGRALDYSLHRVVILVCGGVGINPLLSILSEVAARKRNPELYGSAEPIKAVHFIWVVRTMAMVKFYSHRLAESMKNCTANGIYIRIHLSNSASPPDHSGLRKSQQSMSTSLGGLGCEAFSGHQNEPIDRLIQPNFDKFTNYNSDSYRLMGVFAAGAGEDGGTYPGLDSDDTDIGETEDMILLRTVIHVGRPAFGEIFAEINAELVTLNLVTAFADSKQRTEPVSAYVDSIACLTCGPPSLMQSISDHCFEHGFNFQAQEYRL